MPSLKLICRSASDDRANAADSSSGASTPASSRPRRAGASTSSGATVQRGIGLADPRRQSLKLTVKAAPSKLREVMRANEIDSLQDTLGGGQVLEGPRSTRRSAVASRTGARGNQRPTYAEYGESDIEDTGEEEENENENEQEDENEELDDFDQLGAEPEGGTDDEDVEMEDSPAPAPKRSAVSKPPKITLKPPAARTYSNHSKQPVQAVNRAKPSDSDEVTASDVEQYRRVVSGNRNLKAGPVKSVEEQEMDEDEDEDMLSSSADDLSEQDETTANFNDEIEVDEEEVEVEEADAQGEEDEEDDDDDDLDDSDDETPASGSATPDLSKLTKRQRGKPEDQGTLMALDMAPQQRKVIWQLRRCIDYQPSLTRI